MEHYSVELDEDKLEELAKRAREEARKLLEEERTSFRERKRRTRALILFATGILRELSEEEIEILIERVRQHLRARERGTELNYEIYLRKEIAAVKKLP